MKWQTVIGIISGLGVIVAATFTINNYFAKQCDYEVLAGEFKQYTTENSYDRVQERIWTTEDRLKEVRGKNPQAEYELTNRLRELNDQKHRLERQMDKEKEKK